MVEEVKEGIYFKIKRRVFPQSLFRFVDFRQLAVVLEELPIEGRGCCSLIREQLRIRLWRQIPEGLQISAALSFRKSRILTIRFELLPISIGDGMGVIFPPPGNGRNRIGGFLRG